MRFGTLRAHDWGNRQHAGPFSAELQISVRSSYDNTRVKQTFHTCFRLAAAWKFLLLEWGIVDGMGPDTSQFRDYNYGGGEGKFVTTLNLGRGVNVTFKGDYYSIHTYVGTAGASFVGIVKPGTAFRLISNFSPGFEHLIYVDNYEQTR